MKCKNCGAEVTSKFCEFCGSRVSIEEKKEIDYANKQTCPRCGSSNLEFSREKQAERSTSKKSSYSNKNQTIIVRETVGLCKDCGYTWEPSKLEKEATQNKTLKEQRKKCLWALGWIFCWPIPLCVLIVKSKKLDKHAKGALIGLLCFLFLFLPGCIAFMGDTDSSTPSTKEV